MIRAISAAPVLPFVDMTALVVARASTYVTPIYHRMTARTLHTCNRRRTFDSEPVRCTTVVNQDVFRLVVVHHRYEGWPRNGGGWSKEDSQMHRFRRHITTLDKVADETRSLLVATTPSGTETCAALDDTIRTH